VELNDVGRIREEVEQASAHLPSTPRLRFDKIFPEFLQGQRNIRNIPPERVGA
jgi:hypothetical protein